MVYLTIIKSFLIKNIAWFLVIAGIGLIGAKINAHNVNTISMLTKKNKELTAANMVLSNKLAFQNQLITKASEDSYLLQLEHEAKIKELTEEQQKQKQYYESRWSLAKFDKQTCEENVEVLNKQTPSLLLKWNKK